MTQLVELQRVVGELREAGVEVFAVSNDPVYRLAEFAAKYGITFSLLSDEDSAVIRRFGILNTLIRPEEGRSMRWYGIPYPGTYFTDRHGIVTDKDFHQHHARRASGRALLHRALGRVPEPAVNEPFAATAAADVRLEAYLADQALRLEVISLVVCRLTVADGLHIYAPGAPTNFTPARIEISGDGIRAGEPQWPTASELEVPLLDLSVPVFQGALTVAVPLTATSDAVRMGHGLERLHVDVRVTCHFQACDEHACGLPQEIVVELRLPLAPLVEPEGIRTYVDRQRTSQG